MSERRGIEVVDVVWAWKEVSDKRKKEQCKARKRGLIQFSVMFFAASVVLFLFHHVLIGIVIYFLSFVLLAGIFVAPGILRFFDRFGKILSVLIGRFLTFIFLAPFYYLYFFPGRIILFILRKDPMRRQFGDGSESYWVERTEADDIEHYKVQYR